MSAYAKRIALLATLTTLTAPALAEELDIPIHAISAEGVGEEIGTVRAYDSNNGLVLSMSLTGIPAGPHGFHLHENPSCEPAEKDGKMSAGEAAGGHFDPHGTGHHLGPSGEGHLGDLPVIFVEDAGEVTGTAVAPRLTVADLRGRALMIHEGGDNYRDEPKPLGGGGARIACGVIE
jgi:Cu-Zn family superoxide dismutase